MPSKVFVFINGGDSGSLQVVALSEDGKLMGESLSRSAVLAKENAKKLFRYADHSVVWVDSPNDHPGVVKACALWEAAKEAEVEKTNEDAGALPEEVVREMKNGHACDRCIHRTVCGTAAAIEQHEARGGVVVISACYDRVKVPKE